MGHPKSIDAARKILRPAGENAGLQDDAFVKVFNAGFRDDAFIRVSEVRDFRVFEFSKNQSAITAWAEGRMS